MVDLWTKQLTDELWFDLELAALTAKSVTFPVNHFGKEREPGVVIPQLNQPQLYYMHINISRPKAMQGCDVGVKLMCDKTEPRG